MTPRPRPGLPRCCPNPGWRGSATVTTLGVRGRATEPEEMYAMTRPFPSQLRRNFLALGAALAITPAFAISLGEEKDTALRRSAQGTIKTVDAAARLLVVKLPRGEVTYRVDPKVTNLGELKPGQLVTVDYVVAMAVKLKRGGASMREQVESEAQARAVEGGQILRGATVVTRVVAVDRDAQTVKLKGPQGRVEEFRVQDKADLTGVRVGDRVVAVLYEAVAVGVLPASR